MLLADGALIGATLHDLSAGGAKVEIDGAARLPEGAALALCVEAASPSCNTVLPSRVVWTKPGVCGLMFAGPPRVQS
ncbi:MAG: PilZ domain-containing protein [Deltaproteobacteria bacterium]|nr:PilZ domain-containing protein [Deltaproteobacteria bacterium]